jgi:hypothetical protein
MCVRGKTHLLEFIEFKKNSKEQKCCLNNILQTACKKCIFNMIRLYHSGMPDDILSHQSTEMLHDDYSIIILYKLLRQSINGILTEEYQKILNFFKHTQMNLYDVVSVNFHINSEVKNDDEKNNIFIEFRVGKFNEEQSKQLIDCSSLNLQIIIELFVVFFCIPDENNNKLVSDFISNFVYEILNSKHNISFLKLIMKHDNRYLLEIALSKYDFLTTYLILKKEKDRSGDQYYYKPSELEIDIPMRKIFKYARTVNMLQILCHYCHAESNSDFLRLIKSEINPSTFILNAYCSIDVRDMILIWNVYFRRRPGRYKLIRQPKGVDDPMFHILIPVRHNKNL